MSFQTIDIENESGIQIVKIPENLKINDDKVYLKKVGDALYLIPFHNPWKTIEDSVDEFSEDFMEQRNQPSDKIIRESF